MGCLQTTSTIEVPLKSTMLAYQSTPPLFLPLSLSKIPISPAPTVTSTNSAISPMPLKTLQPHVDQRVEGTALCRPHLAVPVRCNNSKQCQQLFKSRPHSPPPPDLR